MGGYFRLLGSETKEKKAEVEREGKEEEQLVAGEMWWSCTTPMNTDQPVFLLLASWGSYHNHTKKPHKQRPCLSHV